MQHVTRSRAGAGEVTNTRGRERGKSGEGTGRAKTHGGGRRVQRVSPSSSRSLHPLQRIGIMAARTQTRHARAFNAIIIFTCVYILFFAAAFKTKVAVAEETCGLSVDVYSNTELDGEPIYSGVDSQVKYNLKDGGLHGSATDNFSARWSGFITPSVDGVHKVNVVANDGVRLSIDGAVLIDEWEDRDTPKGFGRRVYFETGKFYPITLEYYKSGPSATIKVRLISICGTAPGRVT